jgi:hypothetical protein
MFEDRQTAKLFVYVLPESVDVSARGSNSSGTAINVNYERTICLPNLQ